MAILTIIVDDSTLKRARMRALERDESVNAYLADALRRYADADLAQGMAKLLELAGASGCGSGASGRIWTRNEIHRG